MSWGSGSARSDGSELVAAVDRLCQGVSHWTPARWATTGDEGVTRADLVARLVQRVADLAAAAEGQPMRRVPRLDNDLVLCDQLRVVSSDLVAANPAPGALSEAIRLVDDTRSLLVTRR